MKKSFNLLFIFSILFVIGVNFIVPDGNAEEIKSLLNIESPVPNASLKDNLEISGWVMSNSSNSTIKVYLNDSEITSINRYMRNDVITAVKGFGDNTTNPTPGFSTSLNLSKYPDGKYTVKVDVIDQNRVINSSSRTIQISKVKSIMFIENFQANVEGKTAKIGGWYMTDLKGVTPKIFVDSNEIPNTNVFPRGDVIKAINGYGDIQTTPNPGFGATLDLSGYRDGTHQITVKLINPNTQEVVLQKSNLFILKKSNAKLNVEAPSKNNISGFKLAVSGWMMSTNSDDEIRILLDGNPVQVSRNSRNDVIKAVKGYGDSTTNKNPGFFSDIDISNYDDGGHTLKVQIVNKITNEVIQEESRVIMFNKYQSKMVLEEPGSSKINSSKFVVSGWLMSSDPNQTIKVYLNGQEVATLNRTNRSDVLKAITGYGDKTINPTPGFYQTIDVSNFKDGNYTLEVVAVDSNTGKKLVSQSKKITLKKYATLLNIETSNNITVNTDIAVTGWVMSTSPNTLIKIYIDKKEYTNISRINRLDVIKAVQGYGDSHTNPTPGFTQVLDLTDINDGNHTLKVSVLDSVTLEELTSKTQNFRIKKYKGLLAIESPKANEIVHGTTASISGWLMTDSPSTYFKVYVDNEEVPSLTISRKNRNDVVKAIQGYGNSSTNPTPGFDILIDSSKYKDGQHKITVAVFNQKTNEKIVSESQMIRLKKYFGKLYIESPSRSTFNSSFTLSGWEMSESANSQVELYIDGKKFNTTFTRLSRNDVVNGISGYGDATTNPTPGFSSTINLSNIADGEHTMTVKLISSFGDELTNFSKKILVYRKMYFGMDVSYYQGNIDFTAVKHEGIDFAIIRLGYRGYGTGAMAKDIRAEKYIKDAINNNVDIGLYFFSQAINEQEAIDEANFMLNNIKLLGISGNIKYPIVFDTEFTEAKPNGRADGLSRQQRTNVAKAFLNRIREGGYTPMIYASKSFLYGNLDMSQLQDYDVWVAHYNGTNDPVHDVTDYTGVYHMWQYTSVGSVRGINGNVDLDIAYKKY